jgi:hypothetical protein
MKIAFCFLTYGNLSQPKLWNNIINKNKNKLNVYIHSKNKFIDDEYKLHEYCIEKNISTIYAHKSLIEASLLLFEEAFKNKDNDFFILLSDKCIPLYNFDYIYDKIYSKNTNIMVNWKTIYIERFDTLTDLHFFDRNNFSQSSQWLLLDRNTLDYFLKNNFLYLFSDDFHAADEFYFSNLCNKYNINYDNNFITFVNWSDKSDNEEDRPYPKTYECLTNEMIEQMKETACLFVRKISNKCILPSYYDNF